MLSANLAARAWLADAARPFPGERVSMLHREDPACRGQRRGNSGEFQGNCVMARFGSFALDSARRQITHDGREVHLTPKGYDLLALLVNEAPRVVSKVELHERLWPGTFVSDATLVGLVKELRRALHDRDPRAPIIRTAYGIGYALCPPVERTSSRPSGAWHWIVTNGQRILLREGENVIGRDPTSVVWLDFAGVSRRHACIVVKGADVLVEDLGSKNGTRVGEQPLMGRVPLRDGDGIHVGSIVLVYRHSTSGLSTETQNGRRAPRATLARASD